jgi:hypothetical protein
MIPYLYDYVTHLCKKQEGVIQKCDNVIRTIGQDDALHRNINDSDLVAVRHTISRVSKQWL